MSPEITHLYRFSTNHVRGSNDSDKFLLLDNRNLKCLFRTFSLDASSIVASGPIIKTGWLITFFAETFSAATPFRNAFFNMSPFVMIPTTASLFVTTMHPTSLSSMCWAASLSGPEIPVVTTSVDITSNTFMTDVELISKS